MAQLAERILNRTAHGDEAAGTYADVLFTNADGSQVLVTFWVDGTAQAATRPDAYASWGPPSERTDRLV